MQLVAADGGRWHVVASIRKFDLRHSHQLQDLFRVAGSTDLDTELRDAEFAAVRHLNVPLLSDGEFAQIREQSPQLYNLVQVAPRELHALHVAARHTACDARCGGRTCARC